MGLNGLVGYPPANKDQRASRLVQRVIRVKRARRAGISYSATKSPRSGVRTDSI